MLPPCVNCGYALDGLAVRGVCPECGTSIAFSIARAADQDSWVAAPLWSSLWILVVVNAAMLGTAVAVGALNAVQVEITPRHQVILAVVLIISWVIASFMWIRIGKTISKQFNVASMAGWLGFAMLVGIVLAIVLYLSGVEMYGQYVVFCVGMMAFFRALCLPIVLEHIAGRLFRSDGTAVGVWFSGWAFGLILAFLWTPFILIGWLTQLALLVSFGILVGSRDRIPPRTPL